MKLQVDKIPWYLSWKGLLGTKKPKTIMFRTRFGIHTFGMRYPIDVIVLDKQQIVVNLKENLMPNRLYFWNPKYEIVIELSKGTIKKNHISLGDNCDLASL